MATLGAVALGVAYAAPAMADDCSSNLPACTSTASLPVTATVEDVLSLTLNTPSVSFGSVIPGESSQPQAVTYSVTLNDPSISGYSVVLMAPVGGMSDGSGDNMPNSAINVATRASVSSSRPNMTLTDGANMLWGGLPPEASSFTDTWTLSVPQSQAAGNYTGTYEYEAIAG